MNEKKVIRCMHCGKDILHVTGKDVEMTSHMFSVFLCHHCLEEIKKKCIRK